MSTYNVAVIGAGPAGHLCIGYFCPNWFDVNIDLFERSCPHGLVRHGVAPDHPRIAKIIVALRQDPCSAVIFVFGQCWNSMSPLMTYAHYDAIIIATGADCDAPLNIPGVTRPSPTVLPTFVSWYVTVRLPAQFCRWKRSLWPFWAWECV